MDNINERQVGGSHYRATLQHWDFIENSGIGYIEGCATKYVTRWRKKNGKQDLEKTVHYIEKLISLAETTGRKARGAVTSDVFEKFVAANELTKEEARIIQLLSGEWTKACLREALELTQALLKEEA